MEINKSSAESQSFENSLDMCVCTHIRKAARAITRLYDDALNGTGIRYTQMILLIVLHEHKELTVTHLAEEMLMDASTVARNMRPLDKNNLIVIRKGKDRRQRLISLSEKGNDVVAKGHKYWQEAQNKISLSFTEQQLIGHIASITALANAALSAVENTA